MDLNLSALTSKPLTPKHENLALDAIEVYTESKAPTATSKHWRRLF
jgi:hypothetical protein